jgi:hypothetical protein
MFIPGSGSRFFSHPGSRIRISDSGPGVTKSPDNTAFQAKVFSFSTAGTGIVLTGMFVAFRGVNFTVNNVELVVQCNVVVLAVKPHLYHQVNHPFSSRHISFHPIPSLPFLSHSISSFPSHSI